VYEKGGNMRVKSYREMTEVERKSNSLEAKIVRGLITVSVLLGITLLATGLGLYGYSLGKKYIKDADHISKIAMQSAKARRRCNRICRHCYGKIQKSY
jgi:high-affinity nickel permease